MAGITTAMATSFKVELLEGKHNFTAASNVFKMALFKGTGITGTYDATTTNYSSMTGDETSGTAYTAGGVFLTSITPTAVNGVAIVDFNDASWTAATFSTSGCMIYNTANSGACVGVWSFGSQSVSNGTLTILFPTADDTHAIIQLH